MFKILDLQVETFKNAKICYRIAQEVVEFYWMNLFLIKFY